MLILKYAKYEQSYNTTCKTSSAFYIMLASKNSILLSELYNNYKACLKQLL